MSDHYAVVRERSESSKRLCPMPQYFFDIDNGRPHQDETGEDLADDQAAWHTAMRAAREIEDVLAAGGTWRLTVRSRESPIFVIEIKTKWVR